MCKKGNISRGKRSVDTIQTWIAVECVHRSSCSVPNCTDLQSNHSPRSEFTPELQVDSGCWLHAESPQSFDHHRKERVKKKEVSNEENLNVPLVQWVKLTKTLSNTHAVKGIQLESGAREETGRLRDVKRCVATGNRTRVSGIGLLCHNC